MSYNLTFRYDTIFLHTLKDHLQDEINSSDINYENLSLFKQQLSDLVTVLSKKYHPDEEVIVQKKCVECLTKALDSLQQVKKLIKGITFDNTIFGKVQNWQKITQITNHFTELEQVEFSYTQNSDFTLGLNIMTSTLCLQKIEHIHIHECDTMISNRELDYIEKLIPKDSLKTFKLVVQKSKNINSGLEQIISKLKQQKDLFSLKLSIVSVYDLNVNVLKPLGEFENLTDLQIALTHCSQKHTVIIELVEELTNLYQLQSLELDFWNNELDKSHQNEIKNIIASKMFMLKNIVTKFGHQ